MRFFWKPWLAVLWAVVLAAFFALMYGDTMGLTKVETDRWGGLPLTILLASLSIVMAFPIALVVALGRRSNLPAIRTFLHHLCRTDPRRAADQRAVHGVVHVPAVHAPGRDHRRAACGCWWASRCLRRPTWPK
jgi:hypothetical protein